MDLPPFAIKVRIVTNIIHTDCSNKIETLDTQVFFLPPHSNVHVPVMSIPLKPDHLNTRKTGVYRDFTVFLTNTL